MSQKTCVINPISKRPITVGGKLYRKLVRDGKIKGEPFVMHRKEKIIKKLEKMAKKQKSDIDIDNEIPAKIMEHAKLQKELGLKPKLKKQIKKHLKEEDKSLKHELKENKKLEKKLKGTKKKGKASPAQLAARKKFTEMAKIRAAEAKGKKLSSKLTKTEKKYTEEIDKMRKKGKAAKNLLDRDLEELD